LEDVDGVIFFREVNQGGNRRKLLIIPDDSGSPPVPVQARDNPGRQKSNRLPANG
jgi:hypothetical protein